MGELARGGALSCLEKVNFFALGRQFFILFMFQVIQEPAAVKLILQFSTLLFLYFLVFLTVHYLPLFHPSFSSRFFFSSILLLFFDPFVLLPMFLYCRLQATACPLVGLSVRNASSFWPPFSLFFRHFALLFLCSSGLSRPTINVFSEKSRE